MNVDADSLLSAGDSERQVGALGSDAGERLHDLRVAGQHVVVVVAHANGDVANLRSLPLVERDVGN